MTLFQLLEWVLIYTAVGAFLYVPLYSCLVTDTDWGWDHKVLAAIIAYVLPFGVMAGVVSIGLGIVHFLAWSKTVVLW